MVKALENKYERFIRYHDIDIQAIETAALNSSSTLAGLTDVNTTGATIGQVLVKQADGYGFETVTTSGPDDYYTETETDALLATKADISTVNSIGDRVTTLENEPLPTPAEIGAASLSHNHDISDIVNLSSQLSLKANSSDLANYILTTQKGSANGVATLDAGTKVPFSQLPTGTSSTSVAIGNHTHAIYQQISEKGSASGYASLDSSTKVPIAQIPIGTTSSTVTVGNDPRLSDTRTPVSHATTHNLGGSDQITGIVPAVTVRPTTGLYNGYTIFRTDKGFYETYDGTVWRVRDVVTVGALADITHPYTNQLVALSTDNIIYRYDSSSWVATFYMTAGGHARYKAGAVQSIGTGDVRILYGTAVTTSPDVSVATVSGGTEFTLNRAGLWQIDACMRYSSATGSERYFAVVNGADFNVRYSSQTTQTAQPASLSTSFCRRFAAGAKLSGSAYQASGGAINTDNSFDESNSFSLTWLRP